MRSKQRLALFTFMTFAAISLVVTASASADRYVDDSGSDLASSLCDDPTDPCLTINKAIGKASPGETIFIGGSVGDGDGDDNYGQASVNKRVSLTEADFFSSSGQTDGQAVIDGGGTNGVLVLASGAGASVEGLTIRGTTSLALYAPATVRGNVFDDPDTHDRIVAAAGSGSYMFTGNTILDDGVGEGPIGILSQSTGSPQIAGNTFRNLQVGIVSNVLTPNTGTPAITDNTISGTRFSAGAGIGVVVSAGTTATLTGNHIHNAVDGVETTVGIFVDQTDARPVGATLRRNRVFDHDIGLRVQRTLGAVTLDGDVIANSTQRALELRETGTPGGGDASATNVTLTRSGNLAHEALLVNAQLTLDSSIVGPEGLENQGSGSCAITNSNLIPGDTPAGSASCAPAQFGLGMAPGFVNPAADDFHLSASSPLVDMGNPAGSSSLDLDGQARVLDGNCDGTPRRDVGADEFAASCPVVPVVPVVPVAPASSVATPPQSTGLRAAALKKCKKKKAAAKRRCKKKANLLPV